VAVFLRDHVERLWSEAEEGEIRLFVSAMNVGEVYYFLRKHHSDPLAKSWRELSRTVPVTIEVPVVDYIWNAAILRI